MEMYLKLLVFLSVCYTSNGHLERLTGLLTGAHHQIHNKVHEVAGAVLGGFNFNVGAHVHHTRPPVYQQPNNVPTETVIVIVQEEGQGNQGQNHPQRPHGTPQQNYNQPPNNGYNPNQGYQRPVNQYNGQRPNGQNNYNNGNPGLNQNGQNSYQHGQYGPGQYQNTQNPYQNGQYPNQGGQGNPNQNGYGNNHVNNGNSSTQNGYGITHSNVNNNRPNSNENEVKNPEQNTPKPNVYDNYKPTETNYGQNNDAHNAENAHKEPNDRTTKQPTDDGPLYVPIKDFTYEGDKVTVSAPKRETGTTEKEEEFAIDVRVKEK